MTKIRRRMKNILRIGVAASMIGAGQAKASKKITVAEKAEIERKLGLKTRIVNYKKDKVKYYKYLMNLPAGKMLVKKEAENILSRAYTPGITEKQYKKRIEEEFGFHIQKIDMVNRISFKHAYVPYKKLLDWMNRRLPPTVCHSVEELIDAGRDLLRELERNPMLVPEKKKKPKEYKRKNNKKFERV